MMNALNLYDQLHAIPALRDIPAIITTAITLTEQVAIAARHLAICWKPFEVQDLLDCIERTLHQPRTDSLLFFTQKQQEKEHV